MRRLGLALAALGCTLALAGPASAAPPTRLPDCAGGLHFKPRTVNVFCADAGLQIRRIHWSSWGLERAAGTSRRAYANDCTPNCASGHFHRYRVNLVLRRAQTCPDGSIVFTRMRITFVGRKWPGARRFTQPWSCPLAR